jgi:4a-hydroxytetrahydrobiopterin dehydratase
VDHRRSGGTRCASEDAAAAALGGSDERPAAEPFTSADDSIMREEKVYSEAEVTQRLAEELPHWYYESGTLRRKYRTEGWKGTLMVVNTVGHLAEAAWHHPDLTVSYAFVIVKLTTHSAKGITDKDFALARKIEEVVHWQPAAEGGPLEGTPNNDQRFRYIKYDAK